MISWYFALSASTGRSLSGHLALRSALASRRSTCRGSRGDRISVSTPPTSWNVAPHLSQSPTTPSMCGSDEYVTLPSQSGAGQRLTIMAGTRRFLPHRTSSDGYRRDEGPTGAEPSSNPRVGEHPDGQYLFWFQRGWLRPPCRTGARSSWSFAVVSHVRLRLHVRAGPGQPGARRAVRPPARPRPARVRPRRFLVIRRVVLPPEAPVRGVAV